MFLQMMTDRNRCDANVQTWCSPGVKPPARSRCTFFVLGRCWWWGGKVKRVNGEPHGQKQHALHNRVAEASRAEEQHLLINAMHTVWQKVAGGVGA